MTEHMMEPPEWWKQMAGPVFTFSPDEPAPYFTPFSPDEPGPAFIKGSPFHELAVLFPALTQYADCPFPVLPECREPYQLALLVIHLNDVHRWSREAIADWLDTLEIDLTLKEPACPPCPS